MATARTILVTVCALTLCQCEAERTVVGTRKGTIQFDPAMWGGQGGGNDSQEIRSKFAEKGYTIDEGGNIVADNPNLFANEKARGVDNQFGKKEAKFKNKEARTKEFRTPEYIKRQQFAGVEAAQESGSSAREGNSSRSPDKEARKLFQRTNRQTSSQLATFETDRTGDLNRRFATNSDSVGTEAISEAPVADGIRQKAGYRANAGMTVDDVKKMLSPKVYATQRGL
ncbi:MAG: hypothetical protein AAF491_00630 [Verrucomicrobiota bacterium]